MTETTRRAMLAGLAALPLAPRVALGETVGASPASIRRSTR